MPTISDLTVTALCAGRLSRLITEDEIAQPLRDWMEGRSAALAYLSTCTSCTSVYAAAVASVLPRKLRVALAASELVIIYKTLERSAAASKSLLGVVMPEQDT